jgi:hypothetical protein
VVVHGCNPSIWKAEAGGLRVQDHSGLYSEFEDSLGYVVRL